MTKKVVRPEVQALEAQIDAQKKILLAQKIRLNHLKAQDAKPFMETRFGRFCYSTLEVISRPFANVNKRALCVIDHPLDVQYKELEQDAEELLKEAQTVTDNTQPEAKKVAVHCARLVTKLEGFDARTEKQYHKELQDLNDALRHEIDRLRSPEAQAAKEKLESELKGILKSVQATVASS